MERITLIGECLNYPKERNKLIKYHIVSIYKELMNFGVVCYWLHNIIFHIVTQKTSTTSTIKKKKHQNLDLQIPFTLCCSLPIFFMCCNCWSNL